ncbi:hypothetical protein EU803_09910 [Loktanella sp. IMCC34160]|nr:hypothetical protein EU803_09910 [Loktanella sp. IMCC34160]
MGGYDMSFDWALEPVSDDEPCGPNLDTSDDEEFVEYYFDALGRIPDRYVTPGMETEKGRRTEDRIFDPKSIDIKTEAKQINALLQRSRDVRLLTLLAQFECLAGRIEPMADAIETIADLIKAFGDAVHPAIEGDAGERRDALSELAQPISIVTALRYMGLTGTTDVTLRKLQVAEGKYSPNTGEEDLNAQLLRDSLGSPGNRTKVDAAHAALMRMTDALNRISSASKLSESAPFSPNFSQTLTVLSEMREAITAARPDLRGAEADMADADTDDGADAPAEVAADGAAPAIAPMGQAAPALPPTAVKSHAEARQALVACETYFQTKEPSSAALLLVRQARQLIGMPLVAALETLLPEICGRAIVAFGPQTGFAIPAHRLKSLSDDNLPVPEAGVDDAEVGDPPHIQSSADVATVMRGVEDFFRSREKSSPVPILLQRARSYLDKDFQALVDELIPRPEG